MHITKKRKKKSAEKKISRKDNVMYGNWILKIYVTGQKQKAVARICQRKDLKFHDTYCMCSYIEKPKAVMKKLKRKGFHFSCYKVEYERARNYRQTFFARTVGPYRCRYCNKRLKQQEIYVDHIIPVALAQKSFFARTALKMAGCRGVNDIKNLAPACLRCNLKKSNHMGTWTFRGWAGKSKLYWILLWVLKTAAIFLIIALYIWIIIDGRVSLPPDFYFKNPR